jgi:multidrug efflux pump subunit AcrA (membrane-fusion protein)
MPVGREVDKGLVPVVRKDFVTTVSDLGEVGSEEEYQVVAPFTTKINWMAEEGTFIRKGQKVADLDTEKQEEDLETTQLNLDQKQCDLEEAIANDDAQVFELEQDVAQAEASLQIEQQNLKQLVSERDQAQLVDVAQTLKAVDEQLALLAKEVPDRERLYRQGFASKEELDKVTELRDELTLQRRALSVKLGVTTRGPIQEEVAKERGKVEVARADRDRLVETLGVARRRRPLDLEGIRVQLQNIGESLQDDKDLIRDCHVFAPQDGLLVYGQVWSGNDQVRVNPGDSVSEGDTIARLSNPKRTLIRVSLNSLDLANLKVGQAAHFTLDAFPDHRFEGTVAGIGAVAQRRFRSDRNDVRVVEVDIRAKAPDPRIKPGMTANVEIETARSPNALVVPIQAVRHDGRGAYCLVARDGGQRRTDVGLLGTSETEAAIAKGLDLHDRVILPGRTP